MKSFSQRYGYTNVSDVIIKNEITEPIINSILNYFYDFSNEGRYDLYAHTDLMVWTKFLNKRHETYPPKCKFMDSTNVIETFLLGDEPWYRKLDLLEFIFDTFFKDGAYCGYKHIMYNFDELVMPLNSEFKRHNFAYRIVDRRVVEITSEEEISSIQEALESDISGVSSHISSALRLISSSQIAPDYRNSIKESISAVEACCRKISGKNTLGDSLNSLKKDRVDINPLILDAFSKLYAYTNDRNGIRHALVGDSTSAPSADEAIFMLVSCSAFVNYLTKKDNNIKK